MKDIIRARRQTILRLKDPLKNALKERAKERGVSLNTYIENILYEHVQEPQKSETSPFKAIKDLFGW